MEITEIKTALATPSELVARIKKYQVDTKLDESTKEYQPETHSVMSTLSRPDKKVRKPNAYGLLDENGNLILEDGIEKVARIPLALQKLIVSRAAAFTATPVELQAQPEGEQQITLLAMLKKTWQDNKLDYKSRNIAKAFMAEKECVELWSEDDAEENYWGSLGTPGTALKMRVTILKPSDGNTFYPVFNALGNMTAFGRGYELKIGEKKIEYLDVYTDTTIYRFVNQETGWILEAFKANFFGKIPVIYYSQPRTEWADVQWAIERLEKLLSNFADTNDYFAAPKIVLEGTLKNFATKGESGQIFEMDKGGKMDYLTWDQAPEAIKLEIETLFDLIYTITQTPNITFKEMKGIGNLSGIAIKLMFMDAHGKAKDKQDDYFGECIQRRINLIKAGMAKINVTLQPATSLSITPKFELFMPENEMEQIEMEGKKINNLVNSMPGKALLDLESALEEHPYVKDVATVKKRLDAVEAQERVTLTL